MLSVNWLLVACHVVLFGVAFVVIRNLIIRPYLDGILLREGLLVGGRTASETARARAEVARTDHAARLAEARARAEAKRNVVRDEVRAQNAAALAAASAAAQAKLAEARTALRGQVDAAKSELEGEARTLANALAQAALGRSL